MHQPIVKHTINIFERVYNTLPPLVPQRVILAMKNAIERLRSNYDLDVNDLEYIMVVFGKKIWPYKQAFSDFNNSHLHNLREKLFLQKSSSNLKKKYEQFIDANGSFEDLYSGLIADFFSPEERVELHKLLLDIEEDIHSFATQKLAHDNKKSYLEKIDKFHEILEYMEDQLHELRKFVVEQENEEFSKEIKEHIRGIEYGFAMLGPTVNYEEVRNACEHVKGRKKDMWLYRQTK